MLSVLAKQDESNSKNADEEAEYETNIIEKAIVKIGYLLALGFGEAGSKIIAANIQAGGDIDPMMSG